LRAGEELKRLATACLLAGLAACKSETINDTLVVVEVNSDLAVPAQLDTLEIAVRSAHGGTAAHAWTIGAGTLPVRLGIVPEGSTSGAITVTVTASAAHHPTLIQVATSAFVPNEARTLSLFLGADCVAVAPTCGIDKTCRMKACVAPAEGVTLGPFAGDAGAGGPPDAGPSDGATPDAPMDAPLADAGDAAMSAMPDALVACGALDQICCATAPACQGATSCVASACKCAAPALMCNGACVDSRSDPQNCGACNHGCQGGTCAMGKCTPVVVAMNQDQPSYLTIDDKYLYWRRGPGNGGSIARMSKDGMVAPADLATGLNGTGTMASDNTRLYFFGNQRISACTPPACPGGPQGLAAAKPATSLGVDTIDVTLNASKSRLLWTDQTKLYSVATAGGAPLVHLTGDFPSTAMAGDGQYIYYLDRDGMGVVSLRKRSAVDPPMIGVLVEFPAASSTPRQLALVPGRLLWVTNGAVSTLPIPEPAGTAVPAPLATGNPTRLAVEGGVVFWADYQSASAGRILSCAMTGCRGLAPTLVATTDCGPGFVAADPAAVYWVCAGSGVISKIAR
jgi:hypothetical protein